MLPQSVRRMVGASDGRPLSWIRLLCLVGVACAVLLTVSVFVMSSAPHTSYRHYQHDTEAAMTLHDGDDAGDVMQPALRYPSKRRGDRMAGLSAAAEMAPASVQDENQQVVVNRMRERQQVLRKAEMRMRCPNGRLSETTSRIITVVEESGGYVSSQDVLVIRKSLGRAVLTAKVPSHLLQGVVEAIGSLGGVYSLVHRATEVTGSMVSAEVLLATAQSELQRYVSLYDSVTSVEEKLSILPSLMEYERRVKAHTSELSRLRSSVTFSKLKLIIEEHFFGSPLVPVGTHHSSLPRAVVGGASLLCALGCALAGVTTLFQCLRAHATHAMTVTGNKIRRFLAASSPQTAPQTQSIPSGVPATGESLGTSSHSHQKV